jgi:hypothetical protein
MREARKLHGLPASSPNLDNAQDITTNCLLQRWKFCKGRWFGKVFVIDIFPLQVLWRGDEIELAGRHCKLFPFTKVKLKGRCDFYINTGIDKSWAGESDDTGLQ